MTATFDNGRLPASALGTVEGLPLALPTINAYLRMKAAAKAAGIDIWIAQPIGGYRSFFVQGDMHVHPALYGLSTVSTVNVAAAGWSTHGLGNALDIGSFGSAYGTAGAKRSDWLIQHASEFGFYREFGTKDPNHFHHDGFTAIDPIISAASSGSTTPIQEGPFMALTDAEQTEILNKVRDLFGAIGAGQGTGLPVEASVLANVRAAVSTGNAVLSRVSVVPTPADNAKAAWWDQTVERANADGTVSKIPAIQELADIKTTVIAILANGGIDAKQVASDIAAELTPVSGVSAADVEAAVSRAFARVFVSAQ